MEESRPLKTRCNFSMAVSHCFPFFSFNHALILKMHHLKQTNSQKKFFLQFPFSERFACKLKMFRFPRQLNLVHSGRSP